MERLGAAPPVSADYRMPNPARGSFDVSVYESNARLLEVSRADLDVTFGALAPHLLTTQDQVVHGHLADPDACSSMVETRHLFSVLSNDGFAPERIGLFSAGTGEVPIDVTRRELHGVADPFSSHLAVGAAAFLVASGGSLVLRRAEDIFEGLRSVCRSIQRATGAHVNANVYVSHGNDSGLGLHWDEHDVLAVQLAGTRRWVVRHNQSDAPLRERMIARGLPPVPPTGVGDVASDSVVCPGDALLIPRGCHHEVVSTDELSVHVSFGFTYPIGLGVVGHHQPENIDRPEARNAVNGDVATGVEAAIDQMEADPSVWVGIITANTEGQERPVFCAGADLKAINSGNAAGLNTKRGGFAGFVYRERSKPVIVAVDGLATAGGCEIVLAADLVVATTRSSFGLAEVKRNLIAGAGGLFRLPRAIGQAAAMEAILTGEPIPAARAYELGLISRLVEPGTAVQEAMALAGKITEAAPLAVWASRKVVLAAAYSDDETLKRMTNEEFAKVMGSDDTKEGLTAFIEKRPPNWQGR